MAMECAGSVQLQCILLLSSVCLFVSLLNQVPKVKESPESFLGAALAMKKKISSDTPGCAGYYENDAQSFAVAQNLSVTSTHSGGASIQLNSVIIVPFKWCWDFSSSVFLLFLVIFLHKK